MFMQAYCEDYAKQNTEYDHGEIDKTIKCRWVVGLTRPRHPQDAKGARPTKHITAAPNTLPLPIPVVIPAITINQKDLDNIDLFPIYSPRF
ncbi:MAG: hypothetical protein WDM70_04700 [Nitrosomonadales bacterium]